MAEKIGAGSHTPVLLAEVLAALKIKADGVYLDATVGRGGHAAAILRQLDQRGRLLCVDRDPEAVAEATAKFGSDPRVRVLHAPFSSLAACADRMQGGVMFDGILFDLGVSSPQLDDAARGFSFMHDGPLDMRMNPAEGDTAAEFINRASQRELTLAFRDLGEERFAQRIARAIVTDRDAQPFTGTRQLASLIERIVPSRERSKHPATRVFQAIRIHVNRELEQLRQGLDAALARLNVGGRLAVISFHSLEDRIVKQFLRAQSLPDPMYAGLPNIPAHARPRLTLIGKSIEPSEAETVDNPRARSARLRIAERLAQ
jgi:16S rRNA (cytosine1402-N4)-methyltransferase